MTVVEFHDFGVDVEAEAPPEEDTVDIRDLDPSFGQPAPAPGGTEPGTAEVVPDADGTQPIEPPSAQPLPDDDSGEADVQAAGRRARWGVERLSLPTHPGH